MSNYPDDMNQWNNEPTSPFYEEEDEMSKMMSSMVDDEEMQAELARIQEALTEQWRAEEEEEEREAEYYMELVENLYSAWNDRYDDEY